MNADERLDAAMRALRAPRPAPPELARATRRRVLGTLAERRLRRSASQLAAAAAAVLAVGLGSTAWALTTGRLARWLHGPTHASSAAVQLPDARVATPSRHPAPSAPSTTEPAPTSVVAPPHPSVSPSRVASRVARAPRTAPSVGASPALAPPTEPVAPPTEPAAPRVDPSEDLFRRAHEAHFVTRDMRAALDLWDRYLAASPDGRFAPEACFNRAVALLRLGRRDDARNALRALASSTYRARDVARLLEAIDHDALNTPAREGH